MEQLAPSDGTPAGRIATERLISAALDSDRYPDGTAFVPADAEDVELMLTQSFAERRPVAIIYPDGREVVATPEAGAIAWILLMVGRGLMALRRHRARAEQAPRPSVKVPSTYRVEIRREKAAA
jgi:hypothetical protein